MNNISAYDTWHTSYYDGAIFEGSFEMPVIRGTNLIPDHLIRFSDSCMASRKDHDAWVVPYEHDYKLERVWNNALKYMPNLLKHPGIVSWDFSMYRSMPFALQQWNCFRGRLLGSLYERLGGTCIPNVRPTDKRSLAYAFDGLPRESTIAMGTTGNLLHADDRAIFEMYVGETVLRLRPTNIIVYGSAPDDIFHSAFDAGVNVIAFPNATYLAHSNKRAK